MAAPQATMDAAQVEDEVLEVGAGAARPDPGNESAAPQPRNAPNLRGVFLNDANHFYRANPHLIDAHDNGGRDSAPKNARSKKARSAKSDAWDNLYRLRPKATSLDGTEVTLDADGATHICCCDVTIETPDGTLTMPCNALVKCYKQKGDDRFNTGQALKHATEYHPESKVADDISKRENAKLNKIHDSLELQATTRAPRVAGDKGGMWSIRDHAMLPMSKQQHFKIKAAIVRWMIHSKQMVPQRTLEDPFFKAVLRTATGEPHYSPMGRPELTVWIEQEFNRFRSKLKNLVDLAIKLGGTKCLQLCHDGGTLDSGERFEAIGVQFISPELSIVRS